MSFQNAVLEGSRLDFRGLGVDFGVGDIDAQDLVVKVVLLVLFFSILRRIYLDFVLNCRASFVRNCE